MINPFYIIKDRNGWAFGYSSVNDEIRLDMVGRELFARIEPPNPEQMRFSWVVTFNSNGRSQEYQSFDEIHDDLYSMMEAHGALPRHGSVLAYQSGKFHAEDVVDPREQWADIRQAVKENFMVEAEDSYANES